MKKRLLLFFLSAIVVLTASAQSCKLLSGNDFNLKIHTLIDPKYAPSTDGMPALGYPISVIKFQPNSSATDGVVVSEAGGTGAKVYATYNSATKIVTLHTSASGFTAPEDFSYAFCSFDLMTEIQNLSALNLSATTNMYRMFYDCKNLTTIDLSDANKNLSNVTNMEDMFNGCWKLQNLIFGRNLLNKNVKKTDMLILGSGCTITAVKATRDLLRIGTGIPTDTKWNLLDEGELQDGDVYDNLNDKLKDEITYTRNLANLNYQALYLPYSMKYNDWKNHYQIFEIMGFKETAEKKTFRTLIQEVTDETKPHTCYFIKAKQAGEKKIVTKNTTLYKAEEKTQSFEVNDIKFTFHGTYKGVPANQLYRSEHNIWCMTSGRLCYPTTQNATQKLNPFRWYLEVTDAITGQATNVRFSLWDEEEETEVEMVTADPQIKDGKVIENGRILIIKNGVRYNLNGTKR